jgi:cell division septum initiation protein DivIVA
MDIMFLLERLESQVATGTGVPATRKVLVDKDAILELIDQLRVAVPEEIHAAKRINSEGERILEKAQEEASRVTARAQEQATFLIGERGLLELAEAEGRRVIAQANDAADGVRLGADAYAAQILESLESEVRKALAGIEKGIDVLVARQAELRPEETGPAEGVDSGESAARDLQEWPDAAEDSPAILREEDAGQTVPR